MKTLSIITVVAMLVISATAVGIFIEKMNDNQQQPYVIMTVNGIKENYTLHEPFHFTLTIEGYGMDCGYTKETLTKQNDSIIISEWRQGAGKFSGSICASNGKLDNFNFTGISGYLGALDEAGNYIFTASFVDLTNHQSIVEKRFIVSPTTKTITFDVIQSNMTQEKIPVIINGINSGYSFNCTITGGQIEQANADIVNKELILSIKSTENGVLVADLPRTLIDSKIDGQDSAFIVLEDKTEVLFNQTTTSQSRILSIPFHYGVSQIEIAAPVPIQ